MVEWVVGGLGLGLFGYNRKNFMFDSEQKVRREFQGQNMRIKRWELYREDVRDLVDLTVSKMDNYLIVGTLQLGFTVRFFCEGRPLKADTWPAWLVWLWAVSNVGALLYLTLSMWLAMHASIAAHSFGVRMLTQFVRLPVATREELDAATAKAEDYEQFRLQDMVRLPLLKRQLRRLNAAMASDTASQADEAAAGDGEEMPDAAGDAAALASLAAPEPPEPTADLEHIVLYRHAQENWQAYDAYARVCMAMGTNQMLLSLVFYCLGLLVVEIQAPITALCVVAVLQVSASLIVMLDVYDTDGKGTITIATALLLAHGFCAWLSTLAWTLKTTNVKVAVSWLVPVGFLLHAGWLAFVMYLAGPLQPGRVALPAKFRSVLYLDVFGWLPGPHGQRGGAPSSTSTDRERPSVGHLRDSLRQLCLRLYSELRRDAALWEGQDVADQATLARIDGLRERLQGRAAELERISPGALEGTQEAAAPAAEQVWLKLELSTAGQSVDFFVDCRTGDVRCEPPRAADRILDLESFEHQLMVLEEKVRALAHFPPEAAPGDPRRLVFQPTLMRSDSGSDATTSITMAATTVDDSTERRRGSFQLTENTQPGREFLAPSATVAAGFNPHAAGRTVESESSRAHRPPGLMPWSTVHRASTVMVAIWLLGALWCAILVLFDKSHIIDITPSAPERSARSRGAGLQLEPVSLGPMPRSFLRPLGLACHSAVGPALFIVEKYAVHELPLASGADGHSRGAWRPAFASCLEAAPDFAAGGVRSLHFRCASLGPQGLGCEAVLLSASGRGALRCPVGSRQTVGAAGAAGAGALRTPAVLGRVTLHGGPWSSLVASPDGAATWATDGSSLAHLDLRLGFSDELVPQRALPYSLPQNFSSLHMLSNGAVLGLESAEWLHAWRRDGAQSGSWRLPLGARWSGVCADGRSLFLLGTAISDGSVALWRTQLPTELATA